MNTIKTGILEAVKAFADNDLAYTDNALVVIDPEGATATLLDPDEEADIDALIDADPARDYVAVMDLVNAAPDGSWIPDPEAIDALAAEYDA